MMSIGRRGVSVLQAARLMLATCLLGIPLSSGQRSADRLPLTITTDSLPQASPHEHYEATLTANGGVPPLHWRISGGRLPEGLEMDSTAGVIRGVPSEAGKNPIIITVTDSARPPRTVSHQFTFSSVASLSLEWKKYPQVNSDEISGSVAVANGAREIFDQTVIIMAVNEYGKAFALGYQHFDLRPNLPAQEITFSSSLPRGEYVIHADAIAEVAAKHAIYRSRLETSRPLPVAAP